MVKEKELFVLKMSWDSYIDNLIAQTKDSNGTAHADKACIIGIDGGAKWTTDGHACAFKVGISNAFFGSGTLYNCLCIFAWYTFYS